MTTSRKTRVEPHPLGVIVRQEGANTGELMIAGETWHGHTFAELEKISRTTCVLPADDAPRPANGKAR